MRGGGITMSPPYAAIQVTTLQADAADDAAIAAVCKQAVDEEGQLDVFFANVCSLLPRLHTTDKSLGWSSDDLGPARHDRSAVHGDYANQLSLVSSVTSSGYVSGAILIDACSPAAS